MNFFGWHLDIAPWLGHVLVFAVPLIVGLLLRAIAVRGTKDLQHSPARILGNYFVLWAFLLGSYFLLNRVEIPGIVERVAQKFVLIAFIVSAAFFLSNVLVALLKRWGRRSPELRMVQSPVRFAINLSVAVLGVLIALDTLGIPITPLLTTLGIGGIAVALAIQETLSNFFAGVLIAVDRPVMPGDYIRAETGEEGTVLEIGWRSTRLQTPANTIIIIPNSKLGRVSVTNFSLPDKRIIHAFRVTADPRVDSRYIEKVLLEVLKGAAGKIEGFLLEPAPMVRFSPGFGPTGLEFTLICHLKDVDARLIEDEMRHRILERFRAEGIAMPLAAPPPPPAPLPPIPVK